MKGDAIKLMHYYMIDIISKNIFEKITNHAKYK